MGNRADTVGHHWLFAMGPARVLPHRPDPPDLLRTGAALRSSESDAAANRHPETPGRALSFVHLWTRPLARHRITATRMGHEVCSHECQRNGGGGFAPR